MNDPILQVRSTGMGASIQDAGRPGWRALGVPTGGFMDPDAARSANRLVGNSPGAPVIEWLFHGGNVVFLKPAWIAVTGADGASVPMGKPIQMPAGSTLELIPGKTGVWKYLAIQGGFVSQLHFGSASHDPRSHLGTPIAPGIRLSASVPSGGPPAALKPPTPPSHIDTTPPILRVWQGPQFDLFPPDARNLFFQQSWTVSSRSDRVGYRLLGIPVAGPSKPMISEPVREGSIQIPPEGLPIVTMKDGPTVGGYPKIGMVEPADLHRLAQTRPGHPVRFALIN